METITLQNGLNKFSQFENDFTVSFGTRLRLQPTTMEETGELVRVKTNFIGTLETDALKGLITLAAKWNFKLDIKRSGAGLSILFHREQD